MRCPERLRPLTKLGISWYNYLAQVLLQLRGIPVKEFISSVSPKGQITIPMELRHLLNIHPKDKVAFILEDGHVEIAPAKVSLDALFRSVPALSKPLSDKEMTTIAAEEHARMVVQEG